MENFPKPNIAKKVQENIKPETKEYRDDLAKSLRVLRKNNLHGMAERLLSMEKKGGVVNEERLSDYIQEAGDSFISADLFQDEKYDFAFVDHSGNRNKTIFEKRLKEEVSRHPENGIEFAVLRFINEPEDFSELQSKIDLSSANWDFLIPKLHEIGVHPDVEFLDEYNYPINKENRLFLLGYHLAKEKELLDGLPDNLILNKPLRDKINFLQSQIDLLRD